MGKSNYIRPRKCRPYFSRGLAYFVKKEFDAPMIATKYNNGETGFSIVGVEVPQISWTI